MSWTYLINELRHSISFEKKINIEISYNILQVSISCVSLCFNKKITIRIKINLTLFLQNSLKCCLFPSEITLD